MNKLMIKNELTDMIRSGAVFCPFEAAFYVDGKLLALNKKSKVMSELRPAEVTKWPGLRIFAFDVNYKWDRERREFDHSGFVAGLPEVIKSANLIVLSCEDLIRANEFVSLIQRGEYTGFYPLTDPKRENDIPSPGSSYIYLRK